MAEFLIVYRSLLSLRSLSALIRPLLFILFCLIIALPARSQTTTDSGPKVIMQYDSVYLTVDSVTIDSGRLALHRQDSLVAAPLKKPKMIASMRQMELTGDTIPEVYRIEGKVVPKTDDILLKFTIKQGKKLLFHDSWKAKGYFDPIDSLPNEVKFRRLARIVNSFFANENFTSADSLEFHRLISEVGIGDVKPDSPECSEICTQSRMLYNVFASRDDWYGLVWLPSKRQFVKAWRN